jgi:uncharacterized protein
LNATPRGRLLPALMRVATTKVGRLTTRLLPPSQALVVSVHDVSPHTWADCEIIREELLNLGVRHASWLVVPDHHGRGHFLENPEFCEWMRALPEQGHELVIHGYHHQRARKGNESLAQKLTTRVYTADEGEFFDLDHDAALALVSQAQADFKAAGIEPEGFIAPAWLLSEAGEEALRDAGCKYTTRLRHVRDLHAGRTYDSQSLVWSVRSQWRRSASLAWNAWLFHALRDNPLLRIAIHPVDVHHPRIWRQIRQIVKEALATRLSFSYERWIARQRTFAPQQPAQ